MKRRKFIEQAGIAVSALIIVPTIIIFQGQCVRRGMQFTESMK